MQNLPPGLPPDAAAYLLEAAEVIAYEQRFKPSSPEAMQEWLSANQPEIVKRATELQYELLSKMATPEGKKVKELMSITVWTEVHQRKLISEANAAIEEVIWR
jgi:hypothetical protein